MRISARAGSEDYEVAVEARDGQYEVEIAGTRHHVDVRKLEGDFYSILTGGRSYEVSIEATRDGYLVRHGAAEQRIVLSDPGRRGREGLAAATGPLRIQAVMPGRVVRVLVAAGDAVRAGQGLVVVEAMKMENEVAAPRDGRVRSVAVTAGQTVESGAELAVVE